MHLFGILFHAEKDNTGTCCKQNRVRSSIKLRAILSSKTDRIPMQRNTSYREYNFYTYVVYLIKLQTEVEKISMPKSPTEISTYNS